MMLTSARMRSVVEKVVDFHGRCENVRLFDKNPKMFEIEAEKDEKKEEEDQEEEQKKGAKSKVKDKEEKKEPV